LTYSVLLVGLVKPKQDFGLILQHDALRTSVVYAMTILSGCPSVCLSHWWSHTNVSCLDS